MSLVWRCAVPLLVVLAGCGEPPVVRMVDGRPIAGRFISGEAYALYARGADAEARGDVGAAIQAFSFAAEADPDGPEAWTRLGALRCRAPSPAPSPSPEALDDFARAEKADATFGPLWRERARCLLAHGQATPALAAAERAVALDPDDPGASIVRAEALASAGRAGEAKLALRGLLARRPRSPEAQRALRDLAERTNDEALLRETAPASAPLAAVDAALRAGDLDAARRLAHQARLAWPELAVRAAALGRAAEARAQAELVLGADPADTNARIALAAAADLTGDAPALAAAMRAIPARTTSPSPLARLVFAELLARRAGAEAARAWLGPTPPDAPSPSGDDPLLAATAARVRARLSPP